MKENKRIAVVGGGAGGLAAAIAAAEGGANVTIYERGNRVGKKLLKTGNGRCNLTNTRIAPEDYNHPSFVSPVLTATGSRELLDFFASLGLWTVEDGEGRLYPRSDTAASVLDVLRLGAARRGVEEVCSREVTAVETTGPRWRLVFAGGSRAEADRVILATGGGTALLSPLGHRLVPFSPVLCPLKTDTAPIRGLSGLRVRCCVTLLRRGEPLVREDGEVLFRDGGVSGIVILNLSRFARRGDALSLDLLPEQSEAALAEALRKRDMPTGELFTGIFHKRIGEALRRSAVSGSPEALAYTIKNFLIPVQGCLDASAAQVTRGGADTAGFCPDTLESLLHPGLYCVGEALDIDGRCGGYNLHWAFASGLAAGRSAGNG